MDEHNAELSTLRAELDLVKAELSKKIIEVKLLSSLTTTFSTGYAEYSVEFTNITTAASACTSAIHRYYVDHKNGAIFDPEYVRLRANDLTDAISATTGAINAIVGRVNSQFASAKTGFLSAPGIADSVVNNGR